ncbi:MAG: type I restriction-modification system subunit M N-terminal domain-containing protein [Saprospiraceae bacterium]|nr:type I restriction-modification system subunit M N-terminal domain-containing protein [Saprospiraceae bacterium]
MITGELKSQVDKIWDHFWSGGVANPLTVIEQMTYLLFIRQLDKKQQVEEKKANMLGIPMQKSWYDEKEQVFRWSQFDSFREQIFKGETKKSSFSKMITNANVKNVC